MAPKTILLINGPNLNLLGYREPHIYGSTTLADVESNIRTHCDRLSAPTISTANTSIDTNGENAAERDKITLLTYQSNSCGQIIDRIHAAFHANLAAAKPNPSSLSLLSSSSLSSSSNPHASINPNLASPEGPVDAVIINPGGLTHTSVALRDALVGSSIPFIEVHISNVHAREEFRHKSFLSEKAVGVVAGLGVFGYVAALEFLAGEGGWLKK